MEEAFQLIPEKLGKTMGQARGRWRSRWQTPEQYQEGMKNYYSLITQVDKACEEIVDEIKAQGLYENTLIIFTTDNGTLTGLSVYAVDVVCCGDSNYSMSVSNTLFRYTKKACTTARTVSRASGNPIKSRFAFRSLYTIPACLKEDAAHWTILSLSTLTWPRQS
jgi:hypothetical protein